MSYPAYGTTEFSDLIDDWETVMGSKFPNSGDLSAAMYAEYSANISSGNSLGQTLSSSDFNSTEDDFLGLHSMLNTTQNASEYVFGLSGGVVGTMAQRLNSSAVLDTENVLKTILMSRGASLNEIQTFAGELEKPGQYIFGKTGEKPGQYIFNNAIITHN